MSQGTYRWSGRAAGGLLKTGKNTPVPLKSTDVRVTIKGFIANVSSTLRYLNTEQDPIEVVYEFPLDDQSAVYQFEAKIEDRVIVAECQEKQQARETYQDAVRSCRTATLLELDDNCSDTFRCLVGNLPASTEAVITMSYVTELSLLPDGVVQFVLPLQLHPRYNSPSAGWSGASACTRICPCRRGQWDSVKPVTSRVRSPCNFTFCADVITSGRIQEVKCAGLSKDEVAVEYAEDRKRAKISLVKNAVLFHDLCLQASYEDRNKPNAIIEKGNADKEGILRQDVVMLNFYPELKDSDYSNKYEIILLIDRSESMAGSAIRAAKETLLFFLKSLPPGCYFNIVGFGSEFYSLFTRRDCHGSREYSEETLELACNHQMIMSANMRGTNLLEPLRDIYNRPPMSTHSRTILIMTDGDVSNPGAVIDLVRKNASNTRVFSFGIGRGASTSLIERIARAGRGTAEFVTNMDSMPAQVMKILKQAIRASLTDLHVEWQLDGCPKMVQVPREMPPLFAGDRLVVYGFNSGDQTVLAGQVHLRGKIGERSVEFVVDVEHGKDCSPHDAALPIHRLAAKAEIKQLQDTWRVRSRGLNAFAIPRMPRPRIPNFSSMPKSEDDPEKTKAAIILLSTSANVVSCHTSMVGVDKERKELVVGDLIQRRVPLFDDDEAAILDLQLPLWQQPTSRLLQTRGHLLGLLSQSTKCLPVTANCEYMPTRASPEKAAQMRSTLTNYMAIISLQNFSGEWKLDDELARIIGLTLDQLINAIPIKAMNVWATALAIAFLTLKFSDKRDEWEMIEMKARQWLGRQDLEGHELEDLLKAATDVIQWKQLE